MRAFRKRYFFNWGAKNLTKFVQKGKMGGEGLPARGWMRRRLKDGAPGMEARSGAAAPDAPGPEGVRNASGAQVRKAGRAGDAPTAGEPSEGAADSGTGHFDGGRIEAQNGWRSGESCAGEFGAAMAVRTISARGMERGRVRREGLNAGDEAQGLGAGGSREIERRGRSAGIGCGD